MFFDTRDDVLLRRYADTRRRHPLSHLGLVLADAISLERQALKPLRQIADRVLDTSDLNVHQMRRHILTEYGLSGAGLSLLFESFAYRRGLPPEADFVFDARVLPNPHWDARLRPLSGRDADVRGYLEAQAEVADYVAQVEGFGQFQIVVDLAVADHRRAGPVQGLPAAVQVDDRQPRMGQGAAGRVLDEHAVRAAMAERLDQGAGRAARPQHAGDAAHQTAP